MHKLWRTLCRTLRHWFYSSISIGLTNYKPTIYSLDWSRNSILVNEHRFDFRRCSIIRECSLRKRLRHNQSDMSIKILDIFLWIKRLWKLWLCCFTRRPYFDRKWLFTKQKAWKYENEERHEGNMILIRLLTVFTVESIE